MTETVIFNLYNDFIEKYEQKEELYEFLLRITFFVAIIYTQRKPLGATALKALLCTLKS